MPVLLGVRKRWLLVLRNGSERGFYHTKAFVELLVGDDERNEDANHIVESAGGNGDEAVLVAIHGDGLVSVSAGWRVCTSRTNSMAHMPPRPRTSPINGHFFCQARARSSKRLPIAVERASRPSFSMVSMAASAAAHERGCPQYVPPREPTPGASMISARPVTAAMGMPPPRDFAMVIKSGSMPKCSEANHLPVRAKPDCTSSAIKRIPCLPQMFCSSLK